MAGVLAISVSAPLFGHWSDRIGRRRVLIGACTALVLAALPSYLLLRTGDGAGMLAGYLLMGIVLGAFSWAVLAVVAVIRAPVEPAQTRRLAAGLADRSPRVG